MFKRGATTKKKNTGPAFLLDFPLQPPKKARGTRKKKKKARVISPTARGALFNARLAALAEPRGTLVEPSWNPGGLVEPTSNLTSGPPRTTPDPIWAETPKLSAVGEEKNDAPKRDPKNQNKQKTTHPNGTHNQNKQKTTHPKRAPFQKRT